MSLQYPTWTPIATFIGLILIFSQLQFHTFNDAIIFIGLNIIMLPYYVMFYHLTKKQSKGDSNEKQE